MIGKICNKKLTFAFNNEINFKINAYNFLSICEFSYVLNKKKILKIIRIAFSHCLQSNFFLSVIMEPSLPDIIVLK